LPTDAPNRAEHVNKISARALRQPAVSGLVDAFQQMYSDAECVVAHNATFDRQFIAAKWPNLPQKPWMCSMSDITFLKGGKRQKLNHLAVDHEIPVWGAHRAMADVTTLVSLLSTVPDLETQIRRTLSLPTRAGAGADGRVTSASPTPQPGGGKVLYEVVDVRYDPAKNAEYKAAGFRWVPEAKRWRKEIPKGQPTSFGFEVRLAQAPSCFSAATRRPPAPLPPLPSSTRPGGMSVSAAVGNALSIMMSRGTVHESVDDPVDDPVDDRDDSEGESWDL
jgi:DNA polymerase III epsilon subunit-like protein